MKVRKIVKIRYPKGYTEQQVLEAIEKAVQMLSRSFPFGYFDRDDIKQEARIFGLECLAKFNTARPLENFLFAHIRNRLLNLRRNKFMRSDPPCKKCHDGVFCFDPMPCEAYRKWLATNITKANIMCPTNIEHIEHDNEKHAQCQNDTLDKLATEEILRIIDRELPVEHRAAYLQLRAGIKLSRSKTSEVIDIVRGIIAQASLGEDF